MAGQELSGEVLREIELKIDIRSASILVLPKADELNDANIPRNLHNAAELFLRVGMVDAAERVKRNVADLLDIFANDPDGRTNFHVGRGCVCWSCGYCGMPKNYASTTSNGCGKNDDDVRKLLSPGPCNECGEKEQLNWLKVIKPSSSSSDNNNNNRKKKTKKRKEEELPWIEAPPLTEEETKKKEEAQLAAKRKEVEERVKRALMERVMKDEGGGS